MQEVSVLPGRIRWRCPAIVNNNTLSKYLSAYIDQLAGVRHCAVNPVTSSILVVYDGTKTGLEALRSNILKAIASAYKKGAQELGRYEEYNKLLDNRNRARRRLVVYGLIYLLLKIKHALFGKFFLSANVPALQIAAIVTIIGGYPLLKMLYRKFAKKIPADADILLTVAAVALTLMRESTKGVLVLMLKALNDYITASADLSCQRLLSQSRCQTAEMAWLMQPSREESLVAIGELKPRDTVVVHAGETVPLEGRVVRGGALVDTLHYSGQPLYSRISKGLKVFGGMSVVAGELHVEVLKPPEREAPPSMEGDGLEIRQKVSRYQKWITPVALSAGALGIALGGGFMRFLAVMLALTPSGASTAMSTGMKSYVALLHKHRIYLKRTGAVEKIVDAGAIVFDKTGTLTQGRLRLRSVTSYDRRYPEQELLRIASACESSHYHPIALSLSDVGGKDQAQAEDSVLIPSRGVQAVFEHNKIVIGNRPFLKEKGVRMSERQAKQYAECEMMLYTPVLVAVNGKLAGMIALSESMKDGAEAMMMRLRHQRDARVVLLTGDSEYKAMEIARRLEIGEVYSDCSMRDKAEVVRECKADGPVMMIGDGINDVEAMRAADVSVSFAQSCSDQVRVHSDCVIFDDRLPRLNELISLSEKAYRIMNQSILISQIYSAVFGALALFGRIDAFAAKSYNTVNSLMVLLLNKRIEYLSPERHYYGMPERKALPEVCPDEDEL